MLVHFISRLMHHPELIAHYKKIELDGAARIAFLRDQGICDPRDISAILRFEEDPDELHDRLRDQIDGFFGRVVNPFLKWPGYPIALTQISPTALDKDQPTKLVARGFWFGSDPGALELHVQPDVGQPTRVRATDVSEDPNTHEASASFELTLTEPGTYKATIQRNTSSEADNRPETSQLPNAIVVA